MDIDVNSWNEAIKEVLQVIDNHMEMVDRLTAEMLISGDNYKIRKKESMYVKGLVERLYKE